MNTMGEQSTRDPGGSDATPQGGFWQILKLIRPVAWIIGLVLFFGMQAVFWFAVWPNADPHEMAKMPLGLKIFLPVLASSVLFAMVLLYGYVYVDAKRRAMRYVMWTLLAIFIPYMIGVILYFLLRDPVPTPCPKCRLHGARVFFLLPAMRHGTFPDLPRLQQETRLGLGELRVLRSRRWADQVGADRVTKVGNELGKSLEFGEPGLLIFIRAEAGARGPRGL